MFVHTKILFQSHPCLGPEKKWIRKQNKQAKNKKKENIYFAIIGTYQWNLEALEWAKTKNRKKEEAKNKKYGFKI